MNHLDLFSGIGGFSLAAQRVWGEEHNIVAFVENDKFCQKVLKKHWPDVPIFEDIHDYKYKQTETVDLLTGGFPCQPFSVAGKQRGKEDDRAIWPEMLRVIQEANPTWIIGENVTGIINMELDNVLSDLESAGYETQTYIIPACAVDARHRRDRVWIVCHSKHNGQLTTKIRGGATQGIYNNKERPQQACKSEGSDKQYEDVADSTGARQQRQGMPFNASNQEKNGKRQATTTFNGGIRAIWSVEPNVGRVAHGISSRVDRLKALGNAIVPQVAEVIMRGIKDVSQIKS